MHRVNHISESTWRMDHGDDITTDFSEGLHITNVKEAYGYSSKVNSIRQMLKHNDRCTGLDYMEDTLWYLALQGWYNVHSANVVNPLSATNSWRSTPRAHLVRLQTIQQEPCICPGLQQVYHLRETDLCRVCRSIKSTSLREASEDFGIPNF